MNQGISVKYLNKSFGGFGLTSLMQRVDNEVIRAEDPVSLSVPSVSW